MTEVLPAHPDARIGALPSRTEVVLETIKHGILTGRLRPGQPLVEADLAEQMGVSKTPVREALKTLAGSGLVTMSAYRGAAVREVDAVLARSVYDMRLLLEPVAAARTAAVRRLWDDAREALADADLAADAAGRSMANRAFHRALYAHCGNPLLVKALDELRDQTALLSSAAWARQPSWDQEAAEHRAILAAAESGDGDQVRTLMRSHISSFVARNFPENAED